MRTNFPPALRCMLVAAAFLLVLQPAFSQTKKGFKSLQKGKFDAACLAFARDTSNADLRAAAYFGLAQAWADEKNPARNYRTAMQYQALALGAWKGLKSAQRTPLTKEFKVTFGAIEQLRRTAATNAWKRAETTTSLREIDEFIAVFPKNASYVDRKALKKQTDLVVATATNATVYAELSNLYNRHYDYLRDKLPDVIEPVENRLFEAFLQEKGVTRLPDFYRENATHPLSADLGRNDFPAAWQSATLPPMLEYLANFPTTRFAPFVQKKAVTMLQTNPLDAEAKQKLSDAQRGTLAEIEWQAAGRTLDLNQSYSADQSAVWTSYIRKTAPAPSAFSAVEKMYKFHVGRRDWAGGAALLRDFKPLFPARKGWFDACISLMEGPEYSIKPMALGGAVNTSGDEYVPVISADGQRLYFGAKGRPDNINGEDVFVSERSDTGWTKPLLIASISGYGNQAPLALTADGNRLLVFDSGFPRQSDNTPTGWAPLEPLPVDVSAFHWVGLVQIAANDQVMLLEARSGSARLTDLFVSLRDPAGAWQKPVPLDSLNTAGEDRTAFLHPDMRTLYFSSDGYAGLGNMDVFKTTRLDDTWQHWSTPVNLGKEINTPGQDWAYKVSTDGTTAWFASKTDDNGEDIYYIALPDSMRPQQVKVVSLTLQDEQGQSLTDGRVVLKDAVSGAVLGTYRANPTGQPTTLTVPDDRPYVITLEKEGYYPQSMPLPRQAGGQSAPLNVAWKAPKLSDGMTQVLNIFFDYDQAVLRAESNAELQQIAALAQREGYRVALMGYTDDAGNTAYNLDLSRRRAGAARAAIVGMGVPADRVTAEGFGEASPLVPNDSDAHRAQNRRVMVQLLKK